MADPPPLGLPLAVAPECVARWQNTVASLALVQRGQDFAPRKVYCQGGIFFGKVAKQSQEDIRPHRSSGLRVQMGVRLAGTAPRSVPELSVFRKQID